MSKIRSLCFFWHRRDLRVADNAGLFNALCSSHAVLPVFIFDRSILEGLPDCDARITFIYREVEALKTIYEAHGSSMIVRYGYPTEVWQSLINDYQPSLVITNRDYEPYAKERDQNIFDLLGQHGIAFKGAKDHVLFEKDEVVKDDGLPYTVFTPYMRKWKLKLLTNPIVRFDSEQHLNQLAPSPPLQLPSLESMGFTPTDLPIPSRDIDASVLKRYAEQRDLPAVRGTSRLSVHLRFGTVSIRAAARSALQTSDKWLNELIWRDFYQMILHHFPHSADASFKPAYDRIPWRNATDDFERWCEGKTGYPMVDAGMRELNTTGFMHNRVRMVTASFLTKHLLIDWRLGEHYFALKLLDYDLASNVGGWQWAAGSGCDAAPYFRVFNPTAQQQKFDPDFTYIKRWVPEYGTSAYPNPMVDHAFARKRAIDTYKAALG